MASKTYTMYGLSWPDTIHPVRRELDCLGKGGEWEDRYGKKVGAGNLTHFKNVIRYLWPEVVFHKWNDIIFENYYTHRTIGIIGPSSSGKSHSAALCVLVDYYAFPYETTALFCSTTKEMLENRIWGEVKNLHKRAKQQCNWLPGYTIEGRQRILTDPKNFIEEGRDMRQGLQGVPAKVGQNATNLGSFVGVKNKRVRIVGDELSLLPKVFVDAIANLDKNVNFKAIGLGNPKETTDALGAFCEPSAELGGWDGGIDQTPFTKTWQTRRKGGICIQLPGTDCPNLDGKLGIPLLTQLDIDRDISFYGKESLQFTMFDQGMMPKGQGNRRVLTRQMCLKFNALDTPNWRSTNRTKLACLDAAYGGVGGDRCVLAIMEFGEETPPLDSGTVLTSIASQDSSNPKGRKILSLNEVMIVPISNEVNESPEDQITLYCQQQCESRNIPPRNFFYDSGMRTSLVQSFARIWSHDTSSIDCGDKPSERQVSADIEISCRDYYSKFITELWFSVRLIVEAGQFRGMTEDVMMEFCAREWMIVGANKREVEPKKQTKLKTGRSPDLADCLAIGCFGAVNLGFQIMRLGNDRRRVTDDKWKRDLKERAAAMLANNSLSYA